MKALNRWLIKADLWLIETTMKLAMRDKSARRPAVVGRHRTPDGHRSTMELISSMQAQWGVRT